MQKKAGFLYQKKEQEISERYTYRMGRVSSKNSLGSIYYLYDGGGNVRKETNGNGLPTASYKYDAYGTLLGTSETGIRILQPAISDTGERKPRVLRGIFI